MTVYMPPISRKKRVDEKYNPDSFRVISVDAEETHPKYQTQDYRTSFEPPTPDERLFPDINCSRTRVLPKPTADYRVNNPHPKSCSFIRTDVRLLNEPICTVHTHETHPQQSRWWPARANRGTLDKGEHTLDTIYRNDFLYTKDVAPPATYRHSANPNTTASRGIAPVNYLREKDGTQGFFKESVSYEHQYDSRKDPNYPIRSKRHGAFVYTKMKPEDKQAFIDFHTQLTNEQSRNTTDPRSEPVQPPPSPPAQTNGQEMMAGVPSPKQASPKLAAAKVPSPQMLATVSSPVEWYDPERDTLKPKNCVPNSK